MTWKATVTKPDGSTKTWHDFITEEDATTWCDDMIERMDTSEARETGFHIHPDTVDTFTEIIIGVVTDYIQQFIDQVDNPERLSDMLAGAGDMTYTWDHDLVLYRRAWVHPLYRDQPENDDPPGSILTYDFCHVYQIRDDFRNASYRPAPVRVVVGRVGNTSHYDMRPPGGGFYD